MQRVQITVRFVLLSLVATPAGAQGLRHVDDTDGDRPRVVSVSPADGASITEASTEIRIRFDRPMDPLMMRLKWERGGYRECGAVGYDEQNHEFAIPVVLPPDSDHRLVVNRPSSGLQQRGFQSVEGVAAIPFEWAFKTRALDYGTDGPRPRVVSVDPPSGSEVPLITMVRVKFDREMNPKDYRITASEADRSARKEVRCFPFAQYDQEQQEFTFTLMLPPDWKGRVELRDLRSRQGIAAEPIRLEYSTGRTLQSAEQLARFEQAGRNPKLRAVLEKVRKSRRSLTSVCETVHDIHHSGPTGCLSSLRSNRAVFKMQGPRQFYTDVSEVMQVPFRIGSDGERCWWYIDGSQEEKLVVCPFDVMDEKNVVVCDPFHTQEGDIGSLIERLNLQYLSEERLNGRPCHVLESWQTSLLYNERVTCAITRWWIDAETDRPLRLVQDWGLGLRTIRCFKYERVNEAIPDSEFSPPVIEGLSSSGPEPLGEGYHTRFLNVIDGSSGRMSVRWGKYGDAKRSSSGYN